MTLNLKSMVMTFALFFTLFAAYDLTLIIISHKKHEIVNVAPYIDNRDGRIDETLMYMPWAAKINQYGFSIGDSYLREHLQNQILKPQIPALLSALILKASPSLNIAYILLHALIPSLTVILYMFFLTKIFPSLGYMGIFGVSVITFTELVFIPWALFVKYFKIPYVSIFSGHWVFPWEHLKFSRFFSPGLTFWGIVTVLFWLMSGPQQKKNHAVITGLLIGLQFYIYPHHVPFLGLVFLILLGVQSKSKKDFFKGCLNFLIGFISCSIPFLLSLYELKKTSTASDVFFRVGYDQNILFYSSVVTLLGLSALVLLIKMRNYKKYFELNKNIFLAVVLAANIVCIGTSVLLGQFHLFPQSWLIPLRVTTYLLPILLLGPCFEKNIRAVGLWKWIAPILYVLAIGQEIRAAKTDYFLYVPSKEEQNFRDLISKVKEPSIILSSPNAKSAIVVGETPHFSYIGYGINSGASNNELLRRLMIYSVLEGKNFEQFFSDIFWEMEDPNHLSGKHWVYHHGSEYLNGYMQGEEGKNYFLKHHVAEMNIEYQSIARLDPLLLIRQYQVDYIYMPKIDQKYGVCLDVLAEYFYKVKTECKP